MTDDTKLYVEKYLDALEDDVLYLAELFKAYPEVLNKSDGEIALWLNMVSGAASNCSVYGTSALYHFDGGK